MKTFVDNAGRTWIIQIHVTAIKRVRGLLGIDLYSLVDDSFSGLAKLLSDPVSLVDVLYVLCKDEADKTGVTDEDFGRAMAGDSIEHATDAFLSEYVDFFPDSRVRTGINKVLTMGRDLTVRLLARGTEKMDTIDLDTIDIDGLAKMLNNSSGASPER